MWQKQKTYRVGVPGKIIHCQVVYCQISSHILTRTDACSIWRSWRCLFVSKKQALREAEAGNKWRKRKASFGFVLSKSGWILTKWIAIEWRMLCLCWDLCSDVTSTFPGTTWPGEARRLIAALKLLQCGLISHLTVFLKAFQYKRQASVSSAIKISCLVSCVNTPTNLCVCMSCMQECVWVSVSDFSCIYSVWFKEKYGMNK